MSWEAFGSPQRAVVVTWGTRVGEGRALARTARERGWRRCIVAVSWGTLSVDCRVIVRLWFWERWLLGMKQGASNEVSR